MYWSMCILGCVSITTLLKHRSVFIIKQSVPKALKEQNIMILDKQEVIDDYTEKGWWGDATLIDLFHKTVQEKPDTLALVDPPNRSELAIGEPKQFTYVELSQAVDRVAIGFIDIGITKDDVVMVQLPNIVELVMVYLAAARIGAIVSPLPVQYRTHELNLLIPIAEPKAFITSTDFSGHNYVQMVQKLLPKYHFLETLVALGDDVPENVVSFDDWLEGEAKQDMLNDYLKRNESTANDIFTICWTSGTEANPKGIPRSHNHWIAIAWFSVEGCELDKGCNLLNPFPMVNMSAIGGMLVPWLITQGKLVMHHPLNLSVFIQQIAQEQINYTVAPPVLLNLLLIRPALLEHADLSSIKNIGSGSAPLSPWMVSQWAEKHNINVLNMFGSNEGTALVSGPHDIPSPTERALFFPRFGVDGYEWSIELANAMQSKLVDVETQEIVTERGQAGELALKGPTIFPGYYKRPDLTQKSFDEDGFFYTGDLFSIDGEGEQENRYRFVGRQKDVIIRGGFTISPEEIEVVISGHPSVAEVAVIGCMDQKLCEEYIVAVVVLKPEQILSKSDLIDFMKQEDVAVYKVPKQIKIVESLPRNPVGKILKRELRQQLCDD